MDARIHNNDAGQQGASNERAAAHANPAELDRWVSDTPGPLSGDEIECLLFDDFLTRRAQLHQAAKTHASGIPKQK